MVSLDLKDAYFQVAQVPQIRSVREGVPVQSSLLWPLHGSSGFHTNHGSCFDFSSPFRHSTSSISRRLGDPSFLPRAGSSCLGYSSPALSFAGNRRQLGEVSADSTSAHGVSGSSPGEASLSWRHILILRRAASVILARAFRSSVFNDSARSGRKASDAVTSIRPTAIFGSGRPVCSSPVDSRGPLRPRVVAGSSMLGARYSARSGVPPARLVVVRRLGRGLGEVVRRLGRGLWEEATSGLWSCKEVVLSINARELLAVERALLFFALQIVNCTVAIFADNSTEIAYLHNQEGTRSQLLSSISQRTLRWAVSLPVVLALQFIMGRHNVMADSLSRPNQILGSEWTLKAGVFQDLRKRWPVSIDLFATSINQQCCPYFSPSRDPNALGTDALLQSWNGW